MAPPFTGKSLILHWPIQGEASMKRILFSMLLAILPFGSVLAAPQSKNAKVTLVYQHAAERSRQEHQGRTRRIHWAGGPPGHPHPKSTFIYATVLEGAIRSEIDDGPVMTYKAGQSFFELPGDHHGVIANASNTKPAKLLAVFVVDTNETELTIPSRN
jgi:quercetin dioxygenase-like cupin family protein